MFYAANRPMEGIIELPTDLPLRKLQKCKIPGKTHNSADRDEKQQVQVITKLVKIPLLHCGILYSYRIILIGTSMSRKMRRNM